MVQSKSLVQISEASVLELRSAAPLLAQLKVSFNPALSALDLTPEL